MKAHELLEKPENWTQRTAARTASGENCSTLDECAVKWCLLGALEKCHQGEDLNAIFNKVGDYLHGPISRWNDAPERTHSEVVQALKKLDL